MKITRHPCTRYDLKVGNVKPGYAVAFEHVFHQNHSSGDIFLRADVCSSYKPRADKYWGMTPLINLRTGKLCYIEYDKRCRVVDCSVAIAE